MGERITIEMTDLPSVIDNAKLDGKWSHITVGNGHAPYHFWTVGPSGLFYLYRRMSTGHAGRRRAVELDALVTLHLKT